MSTFKEFMHEVERAPETELPASTHTLIAPQAVLQLAVSGLVSPFSSQGDKAQRFADEVSGLIRDEQFISELSSRIGEPMKQEAENEFVQRGAGLLRQMLYDRLGIKG